MTFAKYPVSGGGGGGGGDITGPGSSVNNNIVLWNGTGGDIIKDAGVSLSSYVDITTDQTIGGIKSFSSGVNITASSNQMTFGAAANKITLNIPNPSVDLTYSFPNDISDGGGNATVAMLQANQTFTGQQTVTTNMFLTSTGPSSGLWLGTSPNRVVLDPGTRSSTAQWTFPDTGASTFAALQGTQTFTGNKTFSGTLTVPATVTYTSAGSIAKSGVGTLTLTNASAAGLTFSGAFTLTVPATGTANLIGTAQTISAIKTHSAAIAFSGGAAANLSIWAASNVLRQRGGTSGWAVDNTSGNAILSATDAGGLTLGPSGGGVDHVINGNVGIGTATPSRSVHIAGNPGILMIEDTGGATNRKKAQIFVDSGIFEINTRNDDDSSLVDNALTINLATGNVGIGTASPGAGLDLFEKDIRITHDNIVNTHKLQWWRSGSERGRIELDFSSSGMTLQADGSFFVKTGGETTNLTVSSTGAVSLGPTSGAAIQHNMYSSYASTTSNQGVIGLRSTSNASNQIFLQCNINSTSPNGGLQRNGTTTGIQFFAGSDVRIKENITDAPPILEKLMGVKIREYTIRGDVGRNWGVVAQELVDVFPEKVNTTDDGTGDELLEGVQPWTVGEAWQYELIKAIQELNAKVEAQAVLIEQLQAV